MSTQHASGALCLAAAVLVTATTLAAAVPARYGFGLSFDQYQTMAITNADLVRFSSSFDVMTNSPLLTAASINTMWSLPPGLSGRPVSHYGAGWLVRPTGGGTYNAWHDGSLFS